MSKLADERKREWIKRWEHDNENVREGWIKRTDGRLGYVYLRNPDYVIRGDFLLRDGVYRRIWIPCRKSWQIQELQYSFDPDNVMCDVEFFAQKANDRMEYEINPQDAETI